MTEKAPTPPTEIQRVIFRIPGIAILGVVFLAACATPVAFGGTSELLAVYLIPLGLFVFVIRTRTVVTPDSITARTIFGCREMPWSALSGFAVTPGFKVQAVTTSGDHITLPTVRARHLPAISEVSGGRVTNPANNVAPANIPVTADPVKPQG